MKKSIVLSIAGLIISNTLSYGAGNILLDTYDSNYGSGILTSYGDGPLVGQGIGNTFTGVLLYSVNPITESATTPETVSLPLNPNWSVAETGTFGYQVEAGYIDVYPSYFAYSGSATTLYFEVVAFNGISYDASEVRGHSASFTANLVPFYAPPNGDQLDNMQPFEVFSVPEPGTTCLFGLGLSILIFFRRK